MGMPNDDELRDSIAPLIEMRDITAPHLAPSRKEKPPPPAPPPVPPPEPTDEPDDFAPLARTAPATDRAACPTSDRLTDLVRREGSEAERSRTAEHLRECQHCRTDLNMLRASASMPEVRTISSIEPRALLMPGIGVLVVAIALWGWFSRNNDKPASPARAVATTGNAAVTERPGPRSSGTPATIPAPVILIEPATGARVQRPVTLTWHAIPEAMRYRVEILDHGNWSAFTVTTEDTSITVPAKSRLRPRRPYRWWVQATLPDGTHQRSAPRAIRIAP